LAVVAVLAFSAGNAMAYRYLGGSYTYYASPAHSWADSGNGPHAYDGTTAMSNGEVLLIPTNQTFDTDTTQVSFTDPQNSTGPGTTVAWSGINNNRFDAILLDLGEQKEIDAIAAVVNIRGGSNISSQWFVVRGSNNGTDWTVLISEEPIQNSGTTGPAEIYSNIFVRPAQRPIGLFYNAGTSNYDLDTVTYRYLKFEVSRNGGDPDTWDTTVLSEIIISIGGPKVVITETGGSTNVAEAGPTSDTYSIYLNSEPTDTVTVTVDPDAQTDVGNGAGTSKDFTFTTSNWNTPQTVTVTAVDDAVFEGAHTSTITHTAASNDVEYDAISIPNVVANVTDNDYPEVVITESGTFANTDVKEAGPTSDSYTLVLSYAPTATVTVTVDPDAQTTVGNGGGVPKDFIFTTGNWSTPQTVTATAVNDATVEGLHSSTIIHTVASSDTNYNGLTVRDVIARVYDNDTTYIEARAVFANANDSASNPADNVGTWDNCAQVLKTNNFNMLFPGVSSGGMTYYPTEVPLLQQRVPQNGDYLAKAIAAGRKYGIEVHYWKRCFLADGASAEFWSTMNANGRVMKNNAGNTVTDWLCPSHPDNQAMIIDSIEEVVSNYPIDGVHLDYIRYESNETCYCSGCRTRYEAWSGTPVTTWPGDCYNGTRYANYRLWRRSVMDNFVHDIEIAVHVIDANMRISASVFGWTSTSDLNNKVAQDYDKWCNQGWLDMVSPMDHYTNNTTFRNAVQWQVSLIGADAYVYPAIGSWQLTNSSIKTQIGYTRSKAADGFHCYNWTTTFRDSTLPYLVSQGTTNTPAIPPHQ
jgi:uncharacterized lipoprotein YddW (UPF0748 family)